MPRYSIKLCDVFQLLHASLNKERAIAVRRAMARCGSEQEGERRKFFDRDDLGSLPTPHRQRLFDKIDYI